MSQLNQFLDSEKQYSEGNVLGLEKFGEQDLHEHELSGWKSPLGRSRPGVSSISKSNHSHGTMDSNLGIGGIHSKSTIKGRSHRRRLRNGKSTQTNKSSSTTSQEEEGDASNESSSGPTLGASVTPRGLMLAEMRSRSKRRLYENEEVSAMGQQRQRLKSNGGSDRTASPTEDEEECSDINDDDDDPHLPTIGRSAPRTRTAPQRTRSGGAGRSSRRAAAAERLLGEVPKSATTSSQAIVPPSADASGSSSLRRLQSSRRSGASAELQPSDGQKSANDNAPTGTSSTRRMRSNSVGRKAGTRRAPPRTKSLDDGLELTGHSRESKDTKEVGSNGIHRSGHSTSSRPSRGRKSSSSSQGGRRSSSKSRSRSHSRSRRHRRSRRHPLASSSGNGPSDDKREGEVDEHRRSSDHDDSDKASGEFAHKETSDQVTQRIEKNKCDSDKESPCNSPKPQRPGIPRSPKHHKARSASSLLDEEKPSSMDFMRPSSVSSSMGTSSRTSEEDGISLGGNEVEVDGEGNEKMDKQTLTDMFNKSTSAFFSAANKSMARLGKRRNNARQKTPENNDAVPSTPVASKGFASFLTLKKAPPDTHAQLDEDDEESLAFSIPSVAEKRQVKRRSSLEGEKRSPLESYLDEDDKALHINLNKSSPSIFTGSLTGSPRNRSSRSLDNSVDDDIPQKNPSKESNPSSPRSSRKDKGDTSHGGEKSDHLRCIPENSIQNDDDGLCSMVGPGQLDNVERLLSDKNSQMHMSMNDLNRFVPLKQPSILDTSQISPTPKSPSSSNETPTDWRPSEKKDEARPKLDVSDAGMPKRAVSLRSGLFDSATPKTPSGVVKAKLDFFRRTPNRSRSSDGGRLGRSRTAPSRSSSAKVADGSVSPFEEPQSPTKLFKNGRPPPSTSTSTTGDKDKPRRTKSGESMFSMLRPDRIARSISGEGLRAMSPASRQKAAAQGLGGPLPPSPLVAGEEASSRKAARPPQPGKPPLSKSSSAPGGSTDAGGSPKFSSPKGSVSSMLSPDADAKQPHQLKAGFISLAEASPMPGTAGPSRILPVTMASPHPTNYRHDRNDDSDDSSNYDEEASPTLDNATEYLQLAFDAPAVPFGDNSTTKIEGDDPASPQLPPKPPIHL